MLVAKFTFAIFNLGYLCCQFWEFWEFLIGSKFGFWLYLLTWSIWSIWLYTHIHIFSVFNNSFLSLSPFPLSPMMFLTHRNTYIAHLELQAKNDHCLVEFVSFDIFYNTIILLKIGKIGSQLYVNTSPYSVYCFLSWLNSNILEATFALVDIMANCI